MKSDSFNTFVGDSAGTWTTGLYNAVLGAYAGYSLTTGSNCTFLGAVAGPYNTSGQNNTAVGSWSLYSNSTGNNNVGIGTETLEFNSTGSSNTASGTLALNSNLTGAGNTASGNVALRDNRTGNSNTAVGGAALLESTNNSFNTAIGASALRHNHSTGSTALGYEALINNNTGINTAVGRDCLYSNTSGTNNSALGQNSGLNNTTGEMNAALGFDALIENQNGSFNTCVGAGAGNNEGTNPDNILALGAEAGHVNSNSNYVEIGNTSCSWIGGQVGWSTYSDQRIKDYVKEDVPGLNFINKLRPVTYKLNIHRENEICGIMDTAFWDEKYFIENIVQSGFIAQEVEQAAHSIAYDFNGVQTPRGNEKLYSLEYASFVVPLTKAVQELSAENETLKGQIAGLHSENASLAEKLTALEKKLEELAATR